MKEEAAQNTAGNAQPADFHYRTALQALAAEDYPDAVSGSRTAFRMDPLNPDYRLLYADALAGVHKYDESTWILLETLAQGLGREDESTYMLGTNFAASGDYDKAMEYFRNYLSLAPDGPHAAHTQQLIALIQAEEDGPRGTSENAGERAACLKAAQGRRFLKQGQYGKAMEVLEGIPHGHAGAASARNSLALACFLSGQQERALQITSEVLAKEPDNITALCNMARFLHDLGRMKDAGPVLRRLDALEAESDDERYKLAVTFCELQQHERAYRRMHEYNQVGQRDSLSLFYEAVAAYNTGRRAEAVSLLADVRKIEYPTVIPDFFLKLVSAAADGAGPDLPYVYKLPVEEARNRIAYLNSCLRLDEEAFRALWQNDLEFEGTLLWALDEAEENMRISVAVLIAGFADAKAEGVLRLLLLRRTLPDVVKQEVAVLLSHIGVSGPYTAYIDGAIHEMFIDRGPGPDAELDGIVSAVRDGAERLGRRDLGQVAVESALQVRFAPDRETLVIDPAALAAAALWLAADAAGSPVDLRSAAQQLGTDERLVREWIDRLMLV